jgi:hypothetical protein
MNSELDVTALLVSEQTTTVHVHMVVTVGAFWGVAF